MFPGVFQIVKVPDFFSEFVRIKTYFSDSFLFQSFFMVVDSNSTFQILSIEMGINEKNWRMTHTMFAA